MDFEGKDSIKKVEWDQGGMIEISLQYLHDETALLCTQLTQLTFTCSNSTIETLKKGVKYVQS